ncbi:MAG: amidase [Myxococcota bacterium]|nr:amidase [Myxococcota bacterium]
MSVEFLSASELSKMLRKREIGSRELTDLYIERIERLDGDINAVVVRDFERAREAADAADRALAEGREGGPLHGLPMTIKEAYDIEGLPTTWGIPAFKDNVATQDAETVRRLKAAGAHFIGKTNVPMNLADFQSYNDIYGTTHNPWDPSRVPGGSSGGSAAALAAGFGALESGSDIGGSIRNPAHFCGVYGHKPTWNIVPQQGHSLPGMLSTPDIAVVGPRARSAEDLALCLDIVAGPEPLSSPGWKLDLPRPTAKKLSDYRVALWPTDPLAPVAHEVSDRVQDLGDRLAGLGAQVSDVARPALDPAESHEVYLYMLNGVMASGLTEEDIAQFEAQAATLDPQDKSTDAIMCRAAVQKHRDWLHYDNRRERLRMVWREFFSDWDILICPQVATAAFEHDHRPFPLRELSVDGRPQPYFQQLFWAGLPTVSYLPSTVFPTGPSGEGLPIGLQAIGAEYNDHICIDFARLLADEWGGFVAPPGY